MGEIDDFGQKLQFVPTEGIRLLPFFAILVNPVARHVVPDPSGRLVLPGCRLDLLRANLVIRLQLCIRHCCSLLS